VGGRLFTFRSIARICVRGSEREVKERGKRVGISVDNLSGAFEEASWLGLGGGGGGGGVFWGG